MAAADKLPPALGVWARRVGRELGPRLKEFRRGVHSFRKSAIAMAGLVLIAAFILMAVFAPALAPPKPGKDPFEIPTVESEAWCPPAAADSESWAFTETPHADPDRGADFTLALPPVNEDVTGRKAWFRVDAYGSDSAPVPYDQFAWTVDGEYKSGGPAFELPLEAAGSHLVRAEVRADTYAVNFTWQVQVPATRATHLIVLSPMTLITITPSTERVLLEILQIRVCNQVLVFNGDATKTVDWSMDAGPVLARSDFKVPQDGLPHAFNATYSRPAYLLGQTESGEDVFYGVIWGSRISMRIGLEVVLISIVAGALLGLLAGYHGRWIDEALMRVTDVFFGLPSLILAMTVIVSLGPTLTNLVIALVIVSWPGYARLIRGVALTVKSNLYVEAARASGTRSASILRRHIFPNSLSPLMVQATLDIGSVVLTAAGLSFIGFSFVTPHTSEWGLLVNLGQRELGASTGQIWWPVLFPGLFIFLFVLGFNMLGDGLRDVLDPRLRR